MGLYENETILETVQLTENSYTITTIRENGSRNIRIINEDPSLTHQQFADEVDINNIMKKYQVTGVLPVTGKQGQYLDVSELPNYQESLEIVMKAEDAFNALPAQIRKKFENDPNQLFEFLKDEKNKDEAITLGLVDKPKETKPDPLTMAIEKLNTTIETTNKKTKKTNDE